MGHFRTFYTSDTFCANAYFLSYNAKTARNVLTVLYGNKYGVGLFTLKLACVIVTCHF